MVYLAAVLCIAEVLTMTGVSTYVALLPVLRADWHTTNTLAGAISGAFFAGYMVAVPMLVSLTDRVAARRFYRGDRGSDGRGGADSVGAARAAVRGGGRLAPRALRDRPARSAPHQLRDRVRGPLLGALRPAVVAGRLPLVRGRRRPRVAT